MSVIMHEEDIARVLDVDVNLMRLQEAVQVIVSAARERKPLACSLVGMHTIARARRDEAIRKRLHFIDLKLLDSMPAALFLRIKGRNAARIRGQDLFNAVCQACAESGLSVFFFGTNQKTLNSLSQRLTQKFPNLRIAGTKPGRYRTLNADEQNEDIEAIKASEADIVWVGLGSPNQDIWVYEMNKLIGRPAIAIGAAFDFEAGTRKTAPRWMQNSGLEWLYRFASDPVRLWKRYLIEAPLFLLEMIKDTIGVAHRSAPELEPPQDRYNVG